MGTTDRTYVVGRVQIPDDLGMECLCPHALLRLGNECLHGSGLQVQRARNLIVAMSTTLKEILTTDQSGVDERKVDRIPFLIALCAFHRGRLDDARSDLASILDVLELGCIHDRMSELRVAIHFDEFH